MEGIDDNVSEIIHQMDPQGNHRIIVVDKGGPAHEGEWVNYSGIATQCVREMTMIAFSEARPSIAGVHLLVKIPGVAQVGMVQR